MGNYLEGLVSVIVPVYNRADLVGKTIESILDQDYNRIEVLVINDGSTDNSLQVIRSFADRYPEKVVVIDQQNSGQVRARNAGLQKARGEFIAFLDSDDTWERQKLSLQIPLFRGDVGLVYSAIREVTANGSCLRTVWCDPGMRGNIYRQLLVQNRMTGGSVVISRRALESVGGFDESFKAAENWDLWIRIAERFRIEFVNQPLVNYLCHSENMSIDRDRMINASWAILQKHLPPERRDEVLQKTYADAYAHYYYNLGVLEFSREEYRQARSRFVECWKYRLFYRDSLVRVCRSVLGARTNRVISHLKSLAVGIMTEPPEQRV